LSHFIAVAEERSFSKAARRVNIVQSGLSASIRSLEQELGLALLARTTRRVDLCAWLPTSKNSKSINENFRVSLLTLLSIAPGPNGGSWRMPTSSIASVISSERSRTRACR